MVYGIGYTKIQLCNNAEVEQYAYELTGKEQAGLAQIQDPRDYDTEGIEIMDRGNRKMIIAGHNVRIQLPVRVIDNITVAGWATFFNYLRGWTEKIKITPWQDQPGYTYWVLLAGGRSPERPDGTRNLVKITTLEFVGEERIDSIS